MKGPEARATVFAAGVPDVIAGDEQKNVAVPGKTLDKAKRRHEQSGPEYSEKQPNAETAAPATARKIGNPNFATGNLRTALRTDSAKREKTAPRKRRISKDRSWSDPWRWRGEARSGGKARLRAFGCWVLGDGVGTGVAFGSLGFSDFDWRLRPATALLAFIASFAFAALSVAPCSVLLLPALAPLRLCSLRSALLAFIVSIALFAFVALSVAPCSALPAPALPP